MTGKIMTWSSCEKEFVRKVDIDKSRMDSIINKAKRRLKRARSTPLTEENVSFIIEDYYEVIKEFLVSYLLKNGLRSKNHQCLISFFLKENPDLEKEAVLIRQMSFFRNRLCYYGEDVPITFYETNKKELDDLIKLLEDLLNN